MESETRIGYEKTHPDKPESNTIKPSKTRTHVKVATNLFPLVLLFSVFFSRNSYVKLITDESNHANSQGHIMSLFLCFVVSWPISRQY